MSAPGVQATCMRLAAETKGAEPLSPGASNSFRWSECEGNSVLDRTMKMSTSRASCSEFLEKARAPMATEEFERILRTEREYWSASCLEEVKSLQKAVSAVQQQAASDRAETEAIRASMRDMRAESECFSAAGTAKMALLEDTVSELRRALQAEREQRGDELRKAEERHRAELAAARSAHESALSAARHEGDTSHVDRMLATLQSDVARLQAASDDRLEEPLQRLCRLSEDLEQNRGSVDSAHQRISELELGQAQARQRISCLDDTQAQALAAQGSIREAVAERTRQSAGDLQQTQEAVRELQAEVRCLAESAKEQEKAPRYTAPDTRMQDEAIEDLRAEVAWLRSSSVEQARRQELIAQRAEQGMAELKASLGQFQQGLERTERRVEEMVQASASEESGGGAADGGSDVLVGSLQRLVQDQRRELSVLSSELGRMRERHESEANRSKQALGAIQAFVEEEKLRRAGESEDATSTKAASRQHQWLAVCERVAEIESRLGATSAQQQQEALPTLLTSARAAAADAEDAEDAKPDAGAGDAEAGAVPVGLKDSLQGVVAAVQKVLQDEDAKRAQEKVLQDSDAKRGPAAAGQSGVPVSPRPAQRLARPLSAARAPAWRAQSQRLAQPLPSPSVAHRPAAIAQPLTQAPPAPVLAIGQRGHGGPIQIGSGTPMLVRR